MKRLLIFLLILTAFSVPVSAQEPSIDPATYLPARTAAYLELRADDAAMTTFDQLISRLSSFAGGAPSNIPFADLLTGILPSVDFQTDILPWVADRFALALVDLPAAGSPGATDFAFVLPIGDTEGANTFIKQMLPRVLEVDIIPQGMLYFGGLFSMATADGVIWIGTPGAVQPIVRAPAGSPSGSLALTVAYQDTRAALPAGALVTGYLSGGVIAEAAADQQMPASPDFPSPAVIWEAALRLHPAQSPAEDALLQFPGLNGVGFALQASADRLDLTAALSLDATYPAPTLATTTAGAALLDAIPGDSFIIFDSYDVSAAALPVAGLALLGPAVGSVFTSVVASLDGSIPPTATPTPTPTPAPPLTADAIIAQVQPIIAQAESMMGMSLDELYGLIGGEYAVAVFPGAGPTIGVALYLDSPDPQRLLDTIDHVSELVVTDPNAYTPLVAIEHITIDGVDVSLLGTPGVDRPALGILDGHVLFVTMESMVTQVIAGASNQAPSPALDWRAAFGDAREALLFLDPRTIDLYAMGRQRIPPLPLTAVVASLDARADGLFVLNLTATLSE